MKKAVAYLRMSTDQQEHSIESQRRLIKDYAARNNYIVLDAYSDSGISGREASKRPAFLKMIDDSANGTFETVLIYDSSRFARNLEQSLVYKSILNRNGVELVSITEPTLDSDTSLITDALFGAMNEMYSRKLSKNVKRGLEQKALRGEYSPAHPFGYCRPIPKQTIQIEPQEAEIVRYIFNRFENGIGFFAITRELSEMGARSHSGNKIDVRSVEYMLTNPTYKGFLRFKTNENAILTQSDHAPIIPPDEFDRVQELMQDYKAKHKKKARPSSEMRHWLSGMVRCSYCGHSFGFSSGYQGRADRFRCSAALRGICKDSRSISVTALEELVLSTLKGIFFGRENWEHLNIKVVSAPMTRDFESEKKLLRQSLVRAQDAYRRGIDTLDEYADFKAHITVEVQKLDDEAQKAENSKPTFDHEAFAMNLANAIEILESNADLQEKQRVLRNLVEKIVLDSQKKHVSCYFYG